ncbi:hypothetical protein V6Z11_A06G014700 [Gossypium hirsutum]|uniref:Uncharacterized protein isoform X1 n=1 Tax=Gossypium hirsutum TaxID=3635 RepID=A0A1U8N6D9_GOSHI|nr:uncharacterized protein LOC107944069 isoform X1 [Gossypium hirsutum]
MELIDLSPEIPSPTSISVKETRSSMARMQRYEYGAVRWPLARGVRGGAGVCTGGCVVPGGCWGCWLRRMGRNLKVWDFFSGPGPKLVTTTLRHDLNLVNKGAEKGLVNTSAICS